MSIRPLRCQTCNSECLYDRCVAFDQGKESLYTVTWRCPNGHGLSADVCPVGPLVPGRHRCLNCGNPYTSDAVDAHCDACGLSRLECPAALGLAETATDPIAAARTAFGQGLFRFGMAILNQAIQGGPELAEAWILKASFLNSIGFNRAAAGMIDDALARFTGTAERILLFEEQSFLWAECDRGEAALRSADSAWELGSKSIRTHYLRGRALGLVGRLKDARREMNEVLTLDPHNAEAQRGLKLINVAIASKPGKSWWQFWR